uniref:ER membrane protein complex subunit 8 n=1 Tax=Ficedula albicollis TaxID=59894 RepID=A0A803WDH4_FICAL
MEGQDTGNGFSQPEGGFRWDIGQELFPGRPALFVDCIPLFHGTLALAPMLEVALTLIDSWCKENSYVIAGYYQANERVKDASPNQVAEKVASRIAEGFTDTALIMVKHSFPSTSVCSDPAAGPGKFSSLAPFMRNSVSLTFQNVLGRRCSKR